MAPRTPSRGGDASPRDPLSARPAHRRARAAAPAAAETGSSPSPRLVVALVRGFRGLRGQVRVELLTDRPEDRFTVGAKLFLEGTNERLTIAEALPVADGPGWWIKFRELPSRNGAEERLRDKYLEIEDPHEQREPGRWFFHELIGLAVTSTTGEALGEITDIYRAGGAEVFVVRGPRGEFDVPGVQAIVKDLAPDEGRMVVDLDNLALDARPVDDEDYVRPRDRRPKKQPKRKPDAAATKPGQPGAAATAPPAGPQKGSRPPRAKSPKASTSSSATPSTPSSPSTSSSPAPEPAPDA